MRIVVATHNPHKVDELRAILDPLVEGLDLVEFTGPEPVEDGDSFVANALIKARAASAHTGLAAIADDSGLSVDTLGGAPGIHSARFAGTRDDADNRALLLDRLGASTDRAARFECAAALVVPPRLEEVGPDGPPAAAESEEFVESAAWHGTILAAARGVGGFGYDPIFLPDGSDLSAAELSADAKNAVSHRALAFTRLAEVIRGRVAG